MCSGELLEDIEDVYPMSDIQKGMVFHSLMESGNTLYHYQKILQIKDREFNVERLKNSFNLLIEKHPILRTSFNLHDFDEPIQIVNKKIMPDIEHLDISHMEKPEQKDYIYRFLIEDRKKSFAFEIGKTLWRIRTFDIGGQNICLIWIAHHSLMDGWSWASLMTEFNNTYLKLKTDPDFIPEKLKNTYKEFIIEQMVISGNSEIIGYWEKELAGYKRFDFNVTVSNERKGIRKMYANNLGPQMLVELKNAAKKSDTTIMHICLAAYIYMLSMISYENDIVVGLVTNNRPQCEDGDKIIGCFLNTIPVRVIIPGNIRWSDFIGIVEKKMRELKKYEKISLFQIVKAIGERTQDKNPIFDTSFNFIDFHIYNKVKPENLQYGALEDEKNGLSFENFGETNVLFDFLVTTTFNNFKISANYDTSVLDNEWVEKLGNYFGKILNKFIYDPEEIISNETLISPEEKQQILCDFNKTSVEYPKHKTIQHLFADQAVKTPSNIALVGLQLSLETHCHTPIEYRELDRKADRWAQLLRQKGVKPNTIVAVMVERSVEMMIGIMAILKAGGAYLPIEPGYPAERVKYILKDSATKLLLGQEATGEKYKNFCQLINLEDMNSYLPGETGNSENSNVSSDLLYVTYTSGSTGKPKGVMIENMHVLNFIKGITDIIEFTENDSILSLTSFTFDIFGLETLLPLTKGSKVVIGSRDEQLDAHEIADLIKRENISIFQLTPSRLKILLFDEESSKSLKSLKYLLVGGEIFPLATLEKARKFTEGRIYNLYGPTETTIWSTLKDVTGEKLLNIGKPIANTQIYILGKNQLLQPRGVVGELCIAGDGVATGYLNLPELTAEKFKEWRSSILYKTGDLVRWLPDGNLDFWGRIDSQVKIRGYRIELGEIENQLLNYSGIKEVLVIAKEDKCGDKHLYAYLVSGKKLPASALREYLVGALPEYMIPTYFVQLEKIPLTPSGKVNRNTLPEPDFEDVKEHMAARNELEKKLSGIWVELLGLGSKKIGIDSNFFELGGHSLSAIMLISKIHKATNVKVSLKRLFEMPTIRKMAEFISEAAEDTFISINKAEEKEYYKPSSTQKRLYIIHQMTPGSLGYNIPQVFIGEGELHEKKLEKTFNLLAERHESLRTSFCLIENQVVQCIHAKVNLPVEFYDNTEEKAEEIISAFIRPFDLSQAPLIRVGLVSIEKSKHILTVDMHHIISDLVSNTILMQDFIMLYEEKELPDLKLQYRDFSEWQNSEMQAKSMKVQEEYWLKQFHGEIPVLKLPTDYVRPPSQSFEGSLIHFEVILRNSDALKSLAIDNGITLYMLILAIYSIFLSKISAQEAVIIGTPIFARSHADFQRIIGMFVNTLALMHYPGGNKTLPAYLEEVKGRTLESFENQDYHFEELVEQVDVERDISRNPLFDVMFVFQNMDFPKKEISGLKLSPYEYKKRIAKFDLTLYATETRENVLFSVEYCTKLFKQETIERFISYFRKIIASILINPDVKISDIEIISEEEKKQILFDFNDTEAEYPENKTIHELFEEQVKRTPDSMAVVGMTQGAGRRAQGEDARRCALCAMRCALTYKELNEKSYQLAYLLKEKGVESDSIVGIMVERSLEMIVGIFGILKAGGAYLPIDPDYPEERIKYILEDSGTKVLLTNQEKIGKWNFINKKIVNGQLSMVNCQWENSVGNSLACSTDHRQHHLPLSPAPVTCLAYIIYTSGSTWKPKGVMVKHCSLVNTLFALFKEYPFSERDAYLLKTSYVFDVSVSEIFGWFWQGGRLAILEKDAENDHGKILGQIKCNGITHINFVPSMFKAFVENLDDQNIRKLSSLRYIFLAGEELLSAPVRTFKKFDSNVVLENIYGPTEATIYTSKYSLKDWDGTGKIPIGKPLNNTKIYILGKGNDLQPIGMPGELGIAGIGAARGYLNNPELTAEKFDHDLWDYQDYHDEKQLAAKTREGTRRREDRRHITMTDNRYSFRRRRLKPVRRTQIPLTINNSQLTINNSSLPPITPIPQPPIYHTGDLARWLPDGNIEFLGRLDHQVKIRGFRIELGEIQHHLLTHEKIQDAVVLAREDKNGNNYLCAYIVSEKEFSVSRLRSYISEKLPDYMVPSYFIQLNKIPLTKNGKVDRKNLPEPGTGNLSREDEYIAPRTIIEKTIANIWEHVLAIYPIGINDNFFEIGGDSIKIIRIISGMKRAGYVIEMKHIFRTPRISGLVPLVKKIEPSKDQEISYRSTRKKKGLTPGDLTYPELSLDMFKQLQDKYSNLIEDIYPLTPMQEGMLFYTLYEHKNRPLYFQQMSYRLHNKLNVIYFKKTLEELFKRHDILRTVFIYEGLNRPLQVVLEKRNSEFYFEDLRESISSPLEKEIFVREFREKDRRRSFDLSKDILMRVAVFQLGDAEFHVIWSSYHILMDGWCMGILISEFSEIFTAFMENRDVQLPIVKPYRNYIQWLAKQEKNKTGNYWKKYLEGYEERAAVPRKESRGTFAGGYQAAAAFTRFEEDKTTALNKVAIGNQVTLNTVIQVVWGVVLGKYSSKQDVVFGMLVSGRPSEVEGIDSMVGCFINTVPVRITFDENIKFNELLRIAQDKAIESEPHHYFSLAEIQAESPLKQNLLDHIIQFQNFPITETGEEPGDNKGRNEKNERIEGPGDDTRKNDNAEPMESANLNVFEQGGDYNFYITIVPLDQIYLGFSYNANVYDRDLVEQLGLNCIRVLEQIIEDDKITIDEISILSEEERRKILFEFNNNRADFPRDQTIYQFIEKYAQITPDRIAIVGGVGTRLIASATYRELNERAHHLANLLRKNGIKKDEPVGILMERSQLMVESILAVWKDGGAYMPIDPGYPDERIDHMLSNSKAKVLVTTQDLSKAIKFEKEIIYLSDPINRVPSTPHLHLSPAPGTAVSSSTLTSTSTCQVGPANLAYIIYTSGSTGKPKGVMIEHIGMMNHIQAKINDLQLTGKSIVAQNATHTFDISVWQFFAALTIGGQTVIYPDELIMEPGIFLSRLKKDQITILEVVPSYLSVLLDDTVAQRSLPLSLQYLLVTGEEIKPHLVKKWFEMYPHIKMINAYGPTEASDDITHYIMDKAPDMERIPIGKPVQNMNIYIADNRMQLCPVGVKGEICVSGVGVGRGYIGDEEKTKQCFIENPFISPINNENPSSFTNDQYPMTNDSPSKLSHSTTPPLTTHHSPHSPHSPHSIIYRTGDLGAWLPDGTIEFFGRKDYQVKIRGFRIELGEIENQLLNHPDIKEAVVIDREDKAGNKYLCAYIVAQLEAHGAGRMEMKAFLSKALPDYMVPAHVVQLDKIPLTSSGKLDRKALPEPEGGEITQKYVAPGNKLEKKLVAIWAEILGKEQEVIGVNQNFFDLGGHSLKAIVLISKIHKELDVKVPLAEVFQRPTISRLADLILISEKFEFIDLKKTEKQEFYQASFNQRRLWIIQQMAPASSSYNLTGRILMEHEVDREVVKKVLYQVMQRHEVLKTGFKIFNDEPFQVVARDVDIPLEVIDLSAVDEPLKQQTREKIFIEEASSPIHLSTVPLFRAILIKLKKSQYEFIFNMHHCITDGWSMRILSREIPLLYEANIKEMEIELPPLRLQYRDFTQWQNRQWSQPRLREKALQYWQEKLKDGIPALDFPFDLKGNRDDPKGASYRLVVKQETKDRLKQMGREHHTTLFTVMFSAFNILLSHLLEQDDIICGIISAGRDHISLRHMVGFFVNALIFKCHVDQEESFPDFLQRMHKEILEAFTCQKYPPELVFEKMKIQYPDISLAFNMLNISEGTADQQLGNLAPRHLETFRDAKFDLEIYASEYKNGIEINCSYKKSLFGPAAIEYIMETYVNLMDNLSAEQDT